MHLARVSQVRGLLDTGIGDRFRGVVADMTAPYSRFESFVYDFAIGRAVANATRATWAGVVAAIPEGGDVVDVGCGGGHLAVAFAEERPDIGVAGLDLSREQVARARRRTARFGERVSISEGSALDMPYADESFDLVFSMASIKHWPDQAMGLSECVRVLRSGGTLIVVEADRGARFDETERFIKRIRQPSFMRPVTLALFRTYVAGRSIDVTEARELVSGLDLDDVLVERVERSPALRIRGRRR